MDHSRVRPRSCDTDDAEEESRDFDVAIRIAVSNFQTSPSSSSNVLLCSRSSSAESHGDVNLIPSLLLRAT